MTDRHEKDGRSPAVAIAAVAGGAALLAGLFTMRKRGRVADEDSPILIKSGSLSAALHDDAGLSVNRGTAHAYTITGSVLRRASWHVTVAKMEAGFPVSLPIPFPKVTEVALTLTKDDNDFLDVITITFAPGVLTFTAAEDDDFGENVKVRRVTKSRKHKDRAFHKKVRDQDDFDIAELKVVSNGRLFKLPSGPDYVLAFDFTDVRR